MKHNSAKRHVAQHNGSQSLLKRLNRSIVLKYLRQRERLSRKELTLLTQLDGKTITNVTQDLLRLGMIKAIGKLSRGVGRPSEMIELNPNYGFALGIDLGASHIAAIAVDFTGSIIARAETKIHYGIRPATVIKRMISMGENVLSEVNNNKKNLLGAGVCAPGSVDRESGIGVWAANLAHWENVPLRKTFEAAFQTLVLVDESTRCAALGEMFARVEEHLDNFLLFDLSLGIGAASVQNGALYYGHNGIAGEIGHTTVKPGGALCRCGKRGCLEVEASGLAIARKYSEIAAKRNNANAKMPMIKHAKTASAKDLADRVSEGDIECKKIFSEAAGMLGIAAANAIMLLDPAHLILMGGLTRAGDLLIQPFRETLRKELRPEILETLTVEISQLGDDGGPLGAASLVLNQIYESPGISMNKNSSASTF